MSEYWVSTPKYWCKFCKVYVRDTKIDRQQHEATGRHQGNIQRSLRDLHRNNDRDEREKQRAKDEVARLNGLVSGTGASSAPSRSGPSPRAPPTVPAPTLSAKAAAEERKLQAAQLADMGVAIPEEYRRDMAMAGEWEVVSETPISMPTTGSRKSDIVAVGVRKRKAEVEEEDDEENLDNQSSKRKAWGSSFKAYPGSNGTAEDFDALLQVNAVGKGSIAEAVKAVKFDHNDVGTAIKQEDDISETKLPPSEATVQTLKDVGDVPTKHLKVEENNTSASQETGSKVVFKKRKPKTARQR